jgi:hypothetical protein
VPAFLPKGDSDGEEENTDDEAEEKEVRLRGVPQVQEEKDGDETITLKRGESDGIDAFVEEVGF